MKNANLFKEMMEMELPVVTSSNGKYSFGIVNSRNNGKRITMSKALAEALDLKDTVMFMPHRGARKLVIAKSLEFPHAVTGKLSGDGKKTCYLTSMVELLTKMFSLDFSKHVSRTFTDIEFDNINGVPVAIISFPNESEKEQSISSAS